MEFSTKYHLCETFSETVSCLHRQNMPKPDLNAFLSVHNGTPIKIKTDLVDYIFASKVIGMHRQWLIVDYDEAMDAFSENIKPGTIFRVRFYREGRYYQFTSKLKRIVSGPEPALILGQPGPLKDLERRRSPRIPCDLPGNMEVKRHIQIDIININARGCRVRFPIGSGSEHDFRKGDRIKLRIKIPERHTGYIVEGDLRQWQILEDRVEAGILFCDPPNALKTYIEQLERTVSTVQ